MRAMRFVIAAVMLAVTAGQAQASFIFDNSVSGLITVTWDETFVMSSGRSTVTSSASYLFLIVKNTFSSLNGGSGTYLAGSATQSVSINGGSLSPVSNWYGWEYRPGSEFNYSMLDSAFGLVTGSLPSFNAGDSLRWVGSMTINVSPPTVRMPDISSGSTTSAYLANYTGQYSNTIQTTVFTGRQTVTPEPTSLALAGFAGIGMAVGAWRRRRQQKQQAA